MRFSTGLVASLSVVGLVAALPEPQAPGSEKFECHSKCGGIISASRKPDFASNCAIYAADYAYCLDCAGPEKQNIWSMYGNSVSSAGEKCDWPTTPGAEMPTEGEEEEETPAPAPTESTTTPAPAPTTTEEVTSTTSTTEATTTTSTTAAAPVETEEPVEEDDEEETPAPVPTTTATVPLTTATPPVVNNGTVGGNSTNGGVEPTQPEADSAAGVKVVSTGLIAAGLAAAAFFL